MPIHSDFPYPLYLVISENDCTELPWLKVAEEAILGGVNIIQLREKNNSTKQLLDKAIALKNMTDKYSIPLIINDVADIAFEINAWGVHVGQSDMQPLDILNKYGNELNIGWSIELPEQLSNKQIDAAQHLGISPVFKTSTKTNTINSWGLEGISQLSKTTDKPLIAIGGMNITNAKQAFDAGANSIAVVSAICSSSDPRRAAEQLKDLLK